jgi:hypothetical protein
LGRIVLGVVLGFVILGSALYILSAVRPQRERARDTSPSLFSDPASIVRTPQIVVDEDLVVPASGAQMRGFTLPSGRPVGLTVDGRQDTAKGFNVFVMTEAEWQNFRAKERFSYHSGLSAPNTRAFRQTSTLPPGNWCVVVQNSENLINGMTVHVKLVVDP